MAGLRRPLQLLLGERRLVDQQVRAVGGDSHRLTRRRVARDHELAPRPRRAHDLLGAHAADRLSALDLSELRPGSQTEPLGGPRIERAGPLVLEQHEPERVRPVADLDRRDPVVVALEHVARPDLDQP